MGWPVTRSTITPEPRDLESLFAEAESYGAPHIWKRNEMGLTGWRAIIDFSTIPGTKLQAKSDGATLADALRGAIENARQIREQFK